MALIHPCVFGSRLGSFPVTRRLANLGYEMKKFNTVVIVRPLKAQSHQL